MARKANTKFDLALTIDSETSGIAIGQLDPTFDPAGERYQAISFGLIITNVDTMKPIDELYVEIKYDDMFYNWNDGAERVHGLSRDYLEKNGLSQKDAAIKIVAFIEKYFGPIDAIRKLVLIGHNVATFDRYFLADLLEQADMRIQFGNRHIDTFTLGVTLLDCYSSDELFDALGLERDPTNHNALQDARHALTAARLLKKLVKNAAYGN